MLDRQRPRRTFRRIAGPLLEDLLSSESPVSDAPMVDDGRRATTTCHRGPAGPGDARYRPATARESDPAPGPGKEDLSQPQPLRLPATSLGGDAADLHAYKSQALLIVNTASKCGLTPQYAGLQRLQERFAGRGFTVLAFPCNQFGRQEPARPTRSARLPGPLRGHLPDLRQDRGQRTRAASAVCVADPGPDADGVAGDIQWNFEKFLVAPGGESVQRFRPQVEPESAGLVDAIESVLPDGELTLGRASGSGGSDRRTPASSWLASSAAAGPS